jgi:hypothetical protein
LVPETFDCESLQPPKSPVPSRNADEELVGIGSALGAVGAGAFGMNSDFDDKAHELRGWSGLVRSPSGWVPKSSSGRPRAKLHRLIVTSGRPT